MRSPLRLIAALLALVLVAAACSSGNVASLEPGDCFNDPPEATELVSDVDIVDCSEPHDNEVFFVYELDALGDEESYFQDCLGEFQGYVGSDYQTSEVFISLFWPTIEGFSDGDNEVICYAFLEPPNKLTGTVQGSGR